MNLFGLNIQWHRDQPADGHTLSAQQQRSLSSPAAAWLRDEPSLPGSSLTNSYEQVVWVYRAINLLAEQVANVPFLFSRGERGRENLITSGPLLDFYARPHPMLNRFQYWELRVMWLMLRGECFRVPIYQDAAGREGLLGETGPGRRLNRILMLDPRHFTAIIDNHQLTGWRYASPGPKGPLPAQVFLPEEVWHDRLPNPFDFWRGLAPLQVAEAPSRTDHSASVFMRGIIENNADTGLIVRTDRWLDPDQQEQILASLRNHKRRAGAADRPLFLCGVTEIVKPELSSTDLQFLENRKFTRSEICAAFGVPEELVASTDYNKYDVMEGARLNFVENRVAPLCSRLEAGEERTVRTIDPSVSGWFDIESLPLMQKARRERLAAARAGFDMGVPLNELNRVLDLGFRPQPWGDKGFVNGQPVQ